MQVLTYNIDPSWEYGTWHFVSVRWGCGRAVVQGLICWLPVLISAGMGRLNMWTVLNHPRLLPAGAIGAFTVALVKPKLCVATILPAARELAPSQAICFWSAQASSE